MSLYENNLPEVMIQFGEWEGEGFKEILFIEHFRVAVLRYFHGVSGRKVERIEKHNETDEIFILTAGEATMLLFEGNDLKGEPRIIPLKKNRACNVKKGVWHQVFLSRDACVIIFERKDTTRENSSYHYPDDEFSKLIISRLKN